MANNLPFEKQTVIVAALAECNSIRSIERQTGVHRDTIMRLGVKVGNVCKELLDSRMRNLACARLEADEIWGFIGKKQKNADLLDRREGFGDVWTFLCIDPVSKLMPTFLCASRRDRYHAVRFMEDLASRLTNRIQLSTDALAAYADAVEMAFGADVDYGQIVKEYSSPSKDEACRYSPAQLVSIHKTAVAGEPLPELVCTSYIERANLTLRTHCKRLARLTLAFSKKRENFEAAIALNLAYYNFVKIHSSLRCTPAMEAGIETTAWNVSDLVNAANN